MIERVAAAVVGAAAGAHLLPSVLTVPAVHRRVAPWLSGASPTDHVALTFDDGPDRTSTPTFLDLLAELEVRATFFVLGSRISGCEDVLARAAGEGHEVAVHCWQHTPHLLRAPWRIGADVARTADAVAEVCGARPSYWRPPNGVISGAGLAAARAAGLQPVLWTADGQDWAASATAGSIVSRIADRLQPGGVVLLHDSDVTSAPGSWRAALGALSAFVEHCRVRGWPVGPLRDHW